MLPAPEQIAADVRLALQEDVGSGDLTARLVPPGVVEAHIVCRQQAVLSGIPWANEVFAQVDADLELSWQLADGDVLNKGQVVCEIRGQAASILTGERAALNFLQTLSATATSTAAYVEAVAGTGVNILDTRKTLPGLRLAQKYAVTCGGGVNHRVGLHDMVLIKENHIAAAGSIAGVLHKAATLYGNTPIEIEVENLRELQEALDAGARRVLLDNFGVEELEEAVTLNAGRARLEASGGVSFDTVATIAATGVDDISVGALTKDVSAVDFSLLFS
ncbi:carboxylating nicotinate-nucleotide diphosphorylase [Thiolapillus brandeum]|uniref:Probable nicotinate-nucleotide pyrophosphorylase [carboxylating] n=1 Tax=Thiolapillus brandeum TaxID=1076588 RepID=A0A7U6GI05_9GAMM|nr:carboxylating nicotinate-nucleotide diphosphorylase [Thiolapillus brandeum]BAO43967.1 nicotinate-nucleotide pyrophosphorylase (carboxylating) [Thiolapillus brandeum]